MANVRALQGLQGTVGQPTVQIIDGSTKFNGVNQHLTKTFGTAGDRRTFTVSYWIKECGKGSSPTNNPHIFAATPSEVTRGGIVHRGTGSDANKIYLYDQSSNTTGCQVWSDSLHRDFASWKHIVWRVDTTDSVERERVRFYVNGQEQSLKFSTTPAQYYEIQLNDNQEHRIGRGYPDDYGNYYLSQLYNISGLALGPGYFGITDPLTGVWRPKKFIAEGTTVNDGTDWSSTSNMSSPGNAFNGNLSNGSVFSSSGNTLTTGSITIKDSIEFYHNRPQTVGINVTINGVTYNLPGPGGGSGTGWFGTLKLPGPITTSGAITIADGASGANSTLYAVRVDGVVMRDSTTQNLDFGTTGFYLPMDDQDDFEKDKSGKGNDFTKQNMGSATFPHVVKDSPSGAVFGGRSQTGITTTSSAPGNYCTLNPSDNIGAALSNGNLTITDTSVYYRTVFGTQTSFNGKHYFEVDVTTLGTTMGVGIFVGNDKTAIDANNYAFDANTYIVMYNGSIYHDGSTYSYQSSYGAGDTVGVAIDSKNKKVWLSKNGTYVSGENPTTGSGGMQSVSGVGAIPDGDIYPVVMVRNATVTANFGQRPFKYAPPQGYSPMNSASLRSNKVVPRPDQYVGVVTYTSANGSAYEVSSLKFSPDLIITKNRDASGDWNLQDTVCGITSVLTFNANYAASAQTDNLNSVTAKGFKIGTGSRFNSSSQKICSWFWKAGGPKIGGQGANEFWIDGKNYASAAAAGLDDGTITPVSASVGTKQGFSIVRWNTESLSGTQSLDTGLTEAPEFVITKVLDQADDWLTFHKDLSSTETLIINNSRAKLSNAAYAHTFNSDGTISGLVVGNPNWWISSRKYAFYSWHSVPGLQKFGSYKGNGSADGTHVELGFRPSVIMIKSSSNAVDWVIFDVERGLYNPISNTLYPNLSDAEYGVNVMIDVLSNGFKLRNTYTNINASSYDYIYAAWAEAPAYNLFGGQSNAR